MTHYLDRPVYDDIAEEAHADHAARYGRPTRREIAEDAGYTEGGRSVTAAALTCKPSSRRGGTARVWRKAGIVTCEACAEAER